MLRSAGDIPAGPQGHMDSATADLRTDGPDVACLGTACPLLPSSSREMGWTLLAGFMVSHRDPTEKSSVVWGTGQTADLRGI